jgi:hypothetical protein
LPEQVVLQALPEQMKPPGHGCAAGGTQVPVEQLPAATELVPEQVAPHAVLQQ